jgi:dUTPase
MPTSSKRLRARASAYAHAAEALYLDWTNDDLEFSEGSRVAQFLEKEYYRLDKLAEKQEEKEKKRGQQGT